MFAGIQISMIFSQGTCHLVQEFTAVSSQWTYFAPLRGDYQRIDFFVFPPIKTRV
jgi:hypothetical protein